jgi:hypothetical protein
VNAEFNWWLLIVGLVVGAGLVAFVSFDGRRREADVDAAERPREALWLARMLEREGHRVEPEVIERTLDLHRAYLEAPPPDDVPAVDVPADDVASELAVDDGVAPERRATDLGQ